MSDDPKRTDDDNPKPKPVKRPSKPRAEWVVTRGIAWTGSDGELVRHRAMTELAADVIPAELVDDYADRGDIIRLTRTGSN